MCVCVSLSLIVGPHRAGAVHDCTVTPEEAAAIEAYVQTLPLDTVTMVPRDIPPDSFSWDYFRLPSGQRVSYLGPSTGAHYHCFLYSEVFTLQVLYASQSDLLGYLVGDPNQRSRGIWLNPHVWYDCADRRDEPQYDPDLHTYCPGEYGNYGIVDC